MPPAFSEAERAECQRLIEWGLAEDLGSEGDITSAALFRSDRAASAVIVARKEGVVSGVEALDLIATAFRRGISVEAFRADGPVEAECRIARISGPLTSILAIERLALNFLTHLSGIATLTAAYCRAVRGTKAGICDTRKTIPGWRNLAKYAVRVGGGVNHRRGLFDAVLIKDNHLAGLAEDHECPIADAVALARAAAWTVIEVEVDTLAQLGEALAAAPNIVLLDNFDAENIGLAVELRDMSAPSVLLEASGGIALDTVAEIAKTGVDRISVGALTHSAPALDLGLDFETNPANSSG